MKIVTKEEVELRIKEKFPNQPFEILEYTRMTKPFVLKCFSCGRTRTFSSPNNFLNAKRKHNLCDCYTTTSSYYKHKETLKEIQEILEQNKDKIKFIRYWYKEDTEKKMIEVKCLKCGQIYSKPFSEFKKNFNCPFCVGKELLNTQAVKSLLSDDYELLGEYNGTNNKILVRHKCGFIWRVTFKTLNRYSGCPKCNKKNSRGERRIISFLISQGIEYEREKRFDWQTNPKRRYDFYIPKYNLICEYNGEQHYKETNFFEKNLEEQQKIDKEKENDAIKNGYNFLVIPYTDFDNIETILSNWFNDYPKRSTS